MSEAKAPKIVRENGYSFDKAIAQAKQSKAYWEDRCELIESELSEANRKLAQAEETADHFNGKANDMYASVFRLSAELKEVNDKIHKQNNEYIEVCFNISAEREVLKEKLSALEAQNERLGVLAEELLKALRYLHDTGIIHDEEKIERWNRRLASEQAGKAGGE